MQDGMSFGTWLGRRRKALDLTQGELAGRIGVAIGTIRKWEADALRPSKAVAERLATLFELAAEERATFVKVARAELAPDRLPQAVLVGATGARPPANAAWLPVPITPLIGRAAEVAAVRRMLEGSVIRLLTLTGTGGIGKTRLALQVAADLHDAFADGTHFIDLAPVREPAHVTATIAAALGVAESVGEPLINSLKAYLRSKALLLALDNFEQVLRAGPMLVELLSAAPRLKLLVTSRAALHLSGEYEYCVPPLALPDPSQRPTVEELSCHAAVALFVERAQAVRTDFRLTPANAAAVAEICHRLDGLPLALELAAARIKLFTPEALLARLDSRLALLTGGARDLPARQQTLRSTIDWSYDLLGAPDQTLFARLATFAGGATVAAVEAVCNVADDLGSEILDILQSLVDKHLIRQDASAWGEPRIGMLETIREYALERLTMREEAPILRRQHAQYYMQLAEEAEPHLHGPQQLAWLERLEAEHENLRLALGWSVGGRDPEVALRLGAAVWLFWYIRGRVSEGCEWLERALNHNAAAPASARAAALGRASAFADMQGEFARAITFAEESLALWRELGDREQLALALNHLAIPTGHAGDVAEAIRLFEESLALYRELDDKEGIAGVLNNLAVQAQGQGDADRAMRLYEESHTLHRELGNEVMVADTLSNIGWVALEKGAHGRAAACFKDGLAVSWKLLYKRHIADALRGLAKASAARGEAERAVRLLGAAEAVNESIGAPQGAHDQAYVARQLPAARAQLGAERCAARWTEGRAMMLDQAVRYALDHDEMRFL